MGDSDEVDVGRVYNSLKNSDARNKAFEYVCSGCSDEPEWFSAKQIAKEIKYSERSVLGALLGDGKRFRREDSLVVLGLMCCRESDVYGDSKLLFSSTVKGQEIFEKNKLKDYAHDTQVASNGEEHAEKGDEEGMTCKE